MSPSRSRVRSEIDIAIKRWLKSYVQDAKRQRRTGCGRVSPTAGSLSVHNRQGHPLDSERPRFRGKSARSLELIEKSREILERIQPASVRAVGYQAFTLGLISEMTKNEMNRLSTQLTFARESGIIPWSWIVDETREPERVSAWADPAAYVETIKRSYRRDRWTDQPARVEVWSEKGTVRGTLRPVLDDYGVTFRVMHGYASATSLYDAARDSRASDKPLEVLYVGDWDPSGLHMSEIDLPGRLEKYGGRLSLFRLALTSGDTRAGLPSFDAETKRSDARFQWFARQFGGRCWELDALSPVVLRERLERAIVGRLDLDAWRRADIAERAECESLSTILAKWPGVAPAQSKSRPARDCSKRNPHSRSRSTVQGS